MTLQTKFIIAGLAAAVTVGALVVVTRRADAEKLHQVATMKLIAEVTQRHMEGDMMHDAIRGDVLSAVLAKRDADKVALQKAAGELSEHYASFKQNLEQNQREPVPADLKAHISEALKALESYHDAAEAVVAGTPETIEQHLAAFNTKFSVMEEENEGISDDLGAWGGKELVAAQEVSAVAGTQAAALSAFAILISLAVPLYAFFGIFRPQGQLIVAMKSLAGGDVSVEVDGTHRQDEVGEIARSLLVFKDNLKERFALEAARQQSERQAVVDKRRMMNALASRFEAQVTGVLEAVTRSVANLEADTQTVRQSVVAVEGRARDTSTSSLRAAENVSSVAAASEEMTSSVMEVSSQASRSRKVVSEAVTTTEQATASAESLEQATTRISDVVGLIQDIAQNISLLSVNASIESTRAGEAGRGFEVVASEVKRLASQTTQATVEISSQIEAVQAVSAQVVKALSAIRKTVDRVDEYSSTIALAVQEQSSATHLISNNIQVAASEAGEINSYMFAITGAVSDASAASGRMATSVETLTQESLRLSTEVTRFLAELRSEDDASSGPAGAHSSGRPAAHRMAGTSSASARASA